MVIYFRQKGYYLALSSPPLLLLLPLRLALPLLFLLPLLLLVAVFVVATDQGDSHGRGLSSYRIMITLLLLPPPPLPPLWHPPPSSISYTSP